MCTFEVIQIFFYMLQEHYGPKLNQATSSRIFFRLSATDFELILNSVGLLIEYQKTKFRVTIPAKVRLVDLGTL